MIGGKGATNKEMRKTRSRKAKIGPAIPTTAQKSDEDDTSEDLASSVKKESESTAYSTDVKSSTKEEDPETIGPLPSEMSQGNEDTVSDEFERRSKRMKDKLVTKVEAEEGPSKREEWMTELPPEMGKNFGLQNRTFSKGSGPQGAEKDRSGWTETPGSKLDKDNGKGKKRKREDEQIQSVREQKLQEEVEEFNGSPVAASTTPDSTQPNVAPSTTSAGTPQPVPANGQSQTNLQQQQHMQQYFQMSDEIRDSIDLLSEQKQNVSEFYGQEFNNSEFNEAKPLADLLINPNITTYSQDASGFSQTPGSSQMIAQAYSHAQQMASSVTSYTHQVPPASNSFTQSVPTQANSMNLTVVNSAGQQENIPAAVQTVVQQAQASTPQPTQALEVNTQVQQQPQQAQPPIPTQTVQGYTDVYASQIAGDVHQQQQHVITFSMANGQNMVIASPQVQQAGQNYVIASQGQANGQNIVIAAPGQQAMQGGNFIVKNEAEEMSQNIVLTQQNLQQALGQNVVLTPEGLAAAAGDQSVMTRQIQQAQTPQQQVINQAGIPMQAGGAQIPQVSLVLPHVNSLFPQVPQQQQQTQQTVASPQAVAQLSTKLDKLLSMMKDSMTTIFEMNKRVEKIESHIFHSGSQPGIITPLKMNNKVKPKIIGPGQATSTVDKTNLKAALSSYLTISDYTASDELKRSDSNSDLFIPVGTVSVLPGQQNVIETSSPNEASETASSTVQELPNESMMPVVMSNQSVPTSDINVPIVDSQSGIAVQVYEENNEQKFELGPGSSKEPNARFSSTSGTPKIAILDPRFWDILVEDFQKNMSSDQIISAMAATRKPLVRSIGTSEISICSTVLKEAESACQGRRERLAKELVFRIFTLGEVYDRNVSGVFYINGKKMENKNKALDPAKMAAIHYLVMKYPPSVVDNPRLERLVWKNCVDRINDALRRIYNWIHKIVDVNSIIDKLPTDSIMMH